VRGANAVGFRCGEDWMDDPTRMRVTTTKVQERMEQKTDREMHREVSAHHPTLATSNYLRFGLTMMMPMHCVIQPERPMIRPNVATTVAATIQARRVVHQPAIRSFTVMVSSFSCRDFHVSFRTHIYQLVSVFVFWENGAVLKYLYNYTTTVSKEIAMMKNVSHLSNKSSRFFVIGLLVRLLYNYTSHSTKIHGAKSIQFYVFLLNYPTDAEQKTQNPPVL
jgi:hypothetical protein